MKKIAYAMFACFGLSVMPTAANAGILYFSEDSNPTGLFSLNTSTGASTALGATGATGATVGLSPGTTPGMLLGTTWTQLAQINADGSGAVNVGVIRQEGLALDPTTGTLYGAINGSFGSFNPADGSTISSLAAPGGDVEGLAYYNGLIYGLADGGNLSAYNIGLASWSLIGNTGVDFDQIGLAYDTGLDILYAKGNQDSFLYSVNPLTAVAARIGDTGIAAGGGLAFVGEQAQVPLPSTLALFALGLLGLGACRKRLAH